MKKTVVILLALLLALSVTACSKNAASTGGDSITVTDMAGRTVTIDGPIEKVVVNWPETMEVVLSITGESGVDKIAAVGENKSSEIVMGLYAEKYPQLADLPAFQSGKEYDTEALIAINPDVFLVNTWDPDSLTETAATLEKAGIATVMVDMSSNAMESPQLAIELIGKIFGEEEKAQEQIDFINTQLALVRDAKLNEKSDKPTVYIEKGSGTAEQYDVTFPSGQWASIAELAGADNIAVGVVEGNGQIDPEYLISSDPDFIFVPGSLGFGHEIEETTALFDAYVSRTGWSTLTAVQNGNFYQLAHIMSRNAMVFYPTLVMAKALYPDEFENVDPNAILREFFDKYMYLDYDLGIWSRHIDD